MPAHSSREEIRAVLASKKLSNPSFPPANTLYAIPEHKISTTELLIDIEGIGPPQSQSEDLLYAEIEKVNQCNHQTNSNVNIRPVRCSTASHLMNKVNDYRKKNRLSKLNLPVFPSIRKRENPSDEPVMRFSENISRKSAPPIEANFLKSEHINKKKEYDDTTDNLEGSIYSQVLVQKKNKPANLDQIVYRNEENVKVPYSSKTPSRQTSGQHLIQNESSYKRFCCVIL